MIETIESLRERLVTLANVVKAFPLLCLLRAPAYLQAVGDQDPEVLAQELVSLGRSGVKLHRAIDTTLRDYTTAALYTEHVIPRVAREKIRNAHKTAYIHELTALQEVEQRIEDPFRLTSYYRTYMKHYRECLAALNQLTLESVHENETPATPADLSIGH